MRITMKLTGTSALVMHNIQLADPLNSWVRAISPLAKKKKKTEEDQLEIARLEFMGGLYVSEAGIVVPAANIQRCLRNAATMRREGRQIERALIFTNIEFPLIYDGPREPSGLWDQEKFRFQTMVRVGQSRVSRMRPRFPAWSLETEWELLTDAMDLDTLARIVNEAGLIEGLGDHRTKGSGRFIGEVVAARAPLRRAS